MEYFLKILLLSLSFLTNIVCSQNYVDIPDTNFRNILAKQGFIKNDKLDVQRAKKTFGIFGLLNKNIKNLNGIQYFTSLNQLNVSGNSIKKIKQLPPYLKYLNVSNNPIKKIKSDLVHLEYLYAENTKLKRVKSFPKLKHLEIGNSKVRKINNISGLKFINAYNTPFETKNKSLKIVENKTANNLKNINSTFFYGIKNNKPIKNITGGNFKFNYISYGQAGIEKGNFNGEIKDSLNYLIIPDFLEPKNQLKKNVVEKEQFVNWINRIKIGDYNYSLKDKTIINLDRIPYGRRSWSVISTHNCYYNVILNLKTDINEIKIQIPLSRDTFSEPLISSRKSSRKMVADKNHIKKMFLLEEIIPLLPDFGYKNWNIYPNYKNSFINWYKQF